MNEIAILAIAIACLVIGVFVGIAAGVNANSVSVTRDCTLVGQVRIDARTFTCHEVTP